MPQARGVDTDNLYDKYWEAVTGRPPTPTRRSEIVAVAMLVLASLNLIVMLAIFGRLGDMLAALKELQDRARAENFGKWMRDN